MEESIATGIMKNVANYLNLSQLDPEAMHEWIYKKVGCEPVVYYEPGGGYDPEDRQWINMVFSTMCKAPVSRDGKLIDIVELKLPPVKVQAHFGKNYDFTAEPGINGLLFFIRLAASNTTMTRGGKCELCTRFFFRTRTGAKYCCDSCRVKSSEIRNKKRKWEHKLYFMHGLKKREKEILMEAKK